MEGHDYIHKYSCGEGTGGAKKKKGQSWRKNGGEDGGGSSGAGHFGLKATSRMWEGVKDGGKNTTRPTGKVKNSFSTETETFLQS